MARNPQKCLSDYHENFALRKPLSDLIANEVVISGISGIFPKSDNVEEFMNNLYNQVDMVTNTEEFWPFKHQEMPKYCGKVNGFDMFDPQFFKIPHGQAEFIDPMNRKLLENAYGALFDAGINPTTLTGSNLAVYVGSAFTDIYTLNVYDVQQRTPYMLTGIGKTMHANRISYWLDCKGPSYSIDLVCNSSIAALEHAFWAIKEGRCRAALVGGANQIIDPMLTLNLKRAGVLCLDGKTKSFDRNADGYVRSEAVSVFFLQKACDAKRVYAEVVHIKSKYWLEPDCNFLPIRKSDNIEEFLRQCYSEINLPTNAVEYVEACGSGIAEADANELEAIAKVYADKNSVMVGSVKSNMGHSEGASDLCSVTKACLAYHKGELPGNIHYNEPHNDVEGVRNGKIKIVTENIPFSQGYTALNSFSYSGMNHHTLMKGHYKEKHLKRYYSSIPRLVLASGRKYKSVSKIFDALKNRPVDAEQISLLHDFFTNNISGHTSRGYIVLDSDEDNRTVNMAESITHYAGTVSPVWFFYSGMGSQWPGMGEELMKIPTIAASIERCHKILQPKGLDLVNILTNKDKDVFHNILHSFVGIAAIQIALTDLLKEMEIVPDNIIGHSLGEQGCAYADECCTTEETMLAAYYRGLVSIETKFPDGLMAAVNLGFKELSLICPPEIEVACHNSSVFSTISGPTNIVSQFLQNLKEQNIFTKKVETANIAYHSKYVAEAGPSLLKKLSGLLKKPKLRSEKWICSSVAPKNWEQANIKYASAEYFTNNLLNNVYFEEAAKFIPENATIIEISPHGLMQAILRQSHSTCTNIPLTNRGNPNPVKMLLEAVGKLYHIGINPKVDILYPKVQYPVSTETPMLSPLVDWAHDDNWASYTLERTTKTKSSSRQFAMVIDDDDWIYLKGHVRNGQIVFPESAFIVLVWETLAMYKGLDYGNMSVLFENVRFEKELYIKKNTIITFNIGLQMGCKRFEICQEGIQIVSGYVDCIDNSNYEPILGDDSVDENDVLNLHDIYLMLGDKGFSYSGQFQSILSFNTKRHKATIKWNDEWVTFLDALLQFNIISNNYDGMISIPASILKLTIDTKIHKQSDYTLNNGMTAMQAVYDNLTFTTRCGGIEIKRVLFNKKGVQNNTLWNRNNRLSFNDTPKDLKSKNMVEVKYACPSLYECEAIHDISTGMMSFSGYNCRNERVMGFVARGALTGFLEADPMLLWPVPPHWSLEDAATVPFHYALAYYCLAIRSNVYWNETILVTDGAGALGQAVISLCSTLNCTIFTTVNNSDEKEFLLKLYPKLQEDNILDNSNETSMIFDAAVKYKTNKSRCNHVISCASGNMRELAMNCVGLMGNFMDINSYDQLKNKNFQPFFCLDFRSYMSIKLSSLFKSEYSYQKKIIHHLISDGIARGIVKPITRTINPSTKISSTLKYMLANKGTALIQPENITNKQNLKVENWSTSDLKPLWKKETNGHVKFSTKMIKITGIEKNSIQENKTLESLNIKDLCLEEIRNLINKNYNIDYSIEELKRFTYARLWNLSLSTSGNVTRKKGLRALYDFIESDEIQAAEPLVKADTKIARCTNQTADEIDATETHLIMIPGFEGHSRIFSSIGERLKIQAVTLQLSPDLEGDSIHEMAVNLFKFIERTFEFTKKFYILGYSFGVNIALELAVLLERQGHEATIYCLDSSPDAIRSYLDAYLGELDDNGLQNLIIREIFKLMTGNECEQLSKELEIMNEWTQKLNMCLKRLKPLVSYSHEYQRAIFDSTYKRIKLAQQFKPNFKLGSKLVLLKGNPHPKVDYSVLSDDYNLSQYTTQPVEVFHIDSAHTTAPYFCGVSNFVNRMLEPKLLLKYKMMNLCEVTSEAGLKIQRTQQINK